MLPAPVFRARNRRLIPIIVVICVGISALVGLSPLAQRSDGIRSKDLSAEMRDGDLVFVKSTSWRARVVSWFGGREERFSHVGILLWKYGRPHIIHAAPEGGSVVLEELSTFLRRATFTEAGVFRLRDTADEGIHRAVVAAEEFAVDRVPFDRDFSLDTIDRLYCTELIIRAFESAGVELLESSRSKADNILLPSEIAVSPILEEVLAVRRAAR